MNAICAWNSEGLRTCTKSDTIRLPAILCKLFTTAVQRRGPSTPVHERLILDLFRCTTNVSIVVKASTQFLWVPVQLSIVKNVGHTAQESHEDDATRKIGATCLGHTSVEGPEGNLRVSWCILVCMYRYQRTERTRGTQKGATET